jgi:hypothetical protein
VEETAFNGKGKKEGDEEAKRRERERERWVRWNDVRVANLMWRYLEEINICMQELRLGSMTQILEIYIQELQMGKEVAQMHR